MSTTTTLTTGDLTTIATRINAAHAEVGAALQRGLAHALEAGRLLADAKAALPHGEWLPWLAAQCPDLSERTAQAYMRLHRHREHIEANPQRVADLSVREALRLLEAPKPTPTTNGVTYTLPGRDAGVRLSGTGAEFFGDLSFSDWLALGRAIADEAERSAGRPKGRHFRGDDDDRVVIADMRAAISAMVEDEPEPVPVRNPLAGFPPAPPWLQLPPETALEAVDHHGHHLHVYPSTSEGFAWLVFEYPNDGGSHIETAPRPVRRDALMAVVADRFGYERATWEHAPCPPLATNPWLTAPEVRQ